MNSVVYFSLLIALSNVCCSFSSSNGIVKSRHIRSLMMDYNWPEPDPSIRKYPHESNCHYYYQREIDDIYTVRKCHVGEIFDYHKHECTKKSNGQCFSDRYGKTKTHEHIHLKIRKLFKCPTSDGNFPDIFDCQKYFHCTDGKPKHRQCHSNKRFDKLRRHCVDRKDVLCADITDVAKININDYKCPRPHGLFADPKVCSMYYECLHRKPSLKICQTGQLFDVTKKRCTAKEQVNCGSKYNPYENTAFELSSTTRTTVSEAETPTETSSLVKETHSETEIIKTIVSVKELSSTESSTAGNIQSSLSSSQPEKATTNEPQSESTEANSKNESNSVNSSTNTASVLSSTHRSTLSETETTTKTSSLVRENHEENEAIKTTVSVKELSSNEPTASNIQASSSSSQHENSTTNLRHTEFEAVTKITLPDNSTILPCPPETCIEDDGAQLRCSTANGVYPYKKDKSRFIRCDNFKIFIRPCAHQQVFDAKQNVCILDLSKAKIKV